MNILIDIRCLQDQPLTGVGEYTAGLLQDLLEKDKANKYFLFGNSLKNLEFLQPEADPPLAKISNYGNIEIIQKRWPNKLLNLCLWLFGRPKIDKLVKAKIDLLILPNWNFVAWSKGVRTRLIAHDLSFEFYPDFFSWKRRLWHKLVNPRKLCKKVDEIIAVSENTKRDLLNLYGVSEEKVKLEYPSLVNYKLQTCPKRSREITNYKQVHKLQIPSSQLTKVKEKYSLPEEFILFLGTIEPRKNLIGVIKAFELFKEKNQSILKLIVAGKRGWLYNDIYKAVSRSKFKKDIQFIGFVEPEDKPSFYQLAKLFVHPSFYEGFGFPHREAGQEGTPSIISQNSSLVENNLGNVCLVDPYNIQSLADLMGVIH